MKLRPRLTLFTVSLILAVVACTSLSTVLSVRYFLRAEMRSNQVTWFKNFRSACADAIHLGDTLAIQTYSESLEKAVPELAYAVFVDDARPGVRIGGIASIQRFNHLKPTCPANGKFTTDVPLPRDIVDDGQKWRYYCQPIQQTTVRGERIRGMIYLGFNVNLREQKLDNLINRMWPWIIWSMLIVLLLGIMASLFLAERLTRPIRHLTAGAKAIGEGTLETQIPVESADELGFLAQEFNLMANRLRELDHLKDDFISSVSHELRSPLSAISGYVELLQSKPLDNIAPEKREKALSIIQESTLRLTHFINDILDLAKLKAGHVDIRATDMSVREIAEDVVLLMQPLFEKKSIVPVVEVPESVPVLFGDEDKIRQVLMNLVSNALKFTATGGKIRILAKNQADFVQVSVQDTGIGIPAEAKDVVFEKFRQARNREDTMGTKGTGLGLAIAKGYVEAHGGRIWLESEVGRGTTVYFTLPAKAEAVVARSPVTI